MGAEAQSGIGSKRALTTIAAYLAVMIAIFLWLRALEIERRVASSRANYYEFKHDSSRDPKLGTHISLPESDAFGRPLLTGLDREKKVLLVVSGGCGECSEKGVNLNELQSAEIERVILVYATSANDIPKHYGKLSEKFRIVSDPANSLAQELNASWLPRYFLLSGYGKLLALQSGPKDRWQRLVEE